MSSHRRGEANEHAASALCPLCTRRDNPRGRATAAARLHNAQRLRVADEAPQRLRKMRVTSWRRHVEPRMHCVAAMMNEGAATNSVSGLLTADHARLDILFDDARRLVGGADFEGARCRFKEFANGLAHHIELEERFLFPAFDARVHMPGPTTVMRHEHRAIEQLIAQANASLDARNPETFATEAGELADILRAHNLKEERVLYPRTDAALDDSARAELVAALQSG